jgi:hypothetical protein
MRAVHAPWLNGGITIPCLPLLSLCVLQVGFVAIRELAVLLRNALSAKTQDAHKEVYCWQVRCNSACTATRQFARLLRRSCHHLAAAI